MFGLDSPPREPRGEEEEGSLIEDLNRPSRQTYTHTYHSHTPHIHSHIPSRLMFGLDSPREVLPARRGPSSFVTPEFNIVAPEFEFVTLDLGFATLECEFVALEVGLLLPSS
jgi:hypothetical protein